MSRVTLSYVWAKAWKKLQGKALYGSTLHRDARAGAGSSLYMASMGRFSYCGYDCNIINCEIGAFCSLANNITIGGASHPADWVSTSPAFFKSKHGGGTSARMAKLSYEGIQSKTVIGDDVWIGNGAILKAGITVGTGAIIGAGSIVTKNVSPYDIIAGNPARVIRKRFDEETAEGLLRSEWWNMPEEKLAEYAELMDNPNNFLKMIQEKS